MLCKAYAMILANVLCFLAAVTSTYATTVSNTNDSGPGSLRQAIVDTPSGGTVDFALAGCPCTIVLTTGELVIGRSVTILGPGANLLTVSGNQNSRVFSILGLAGFGPVIIDSIKISDGENGIRVVGTNLPLTLRSSVVSNNFASDGGGISVEGAVLTVVDSTISNNHATVGGGIRVAYDSRLVILRSTIANNSANFAGGGVHITLSSIATIIDSTIEGNIADGQAWLSNNNSVTTVTNSTISGNVGKFDSGGGIINQAFDDVDFGPQTATLTVRNSTIVGNHGTYFRAGTGLISRFDGLSVAETTIQNTIIAGNFPASQADVGGIGIVSSGFNLVGAGSGLVFNGPGDQIGTIKSPIDPKLEMLAFNGGPTRTHALRLDSPALDKGKAFGLSLDQRGIARPNDNPDVANPKGGDGSDIGSFESQFSIAATATVLGRVTGQCMAMRPRGYVILTDSDQQRRFSMINSFGYYVFHHVPLERTYTISLRSKGWSMSPQVIFVSDPVFSLDLTPIFTP